MWPFDVRMIMDIPGQPYDMMTSPFAFPRLPTRLTPPMGISKVSKIKDNIIQDSDLMIGRLSEYHRMFQNYAAGLFNLSPNGFMPGHPIRMRMQTMETLQEENERLRTERKKLFDIGNQRVREANEQTRRDRQTALQAIAKRDKIIADLKEELAKTKCKNGNTEPIIIKDDDHNNPNPMSIRNLLQ